MSTAIVEAHVPVKLNALSRMLTPATAATQSFIAWAWRYLLAHLAFRYTKTLLVSHELRAPDILSLILMLAALTSAFAAPRRIGVSKATAAMAVAVDMADMFPINSNHSFLEALLLALFLLVDFTKSEQRDLLVAMGRWLVVFVMLQSGLQKVLHGAYFNGMYLATELDHERLQLQWVFRHVLQPNELGALLEALRAGRDGPFMFHSPAAVVLSNSVYLSELLVAVLLLRERTRLHGAVLGVAVLVAIEVVAVEISFGILSLNLLMLFFPMPWRVHLAAVSLLAYVGLLVAQWTVGPDVYFFV
jgi:hypothetical protein